MDYATFCENRVILASGVSSQYTRVTDDDDRETIQLNVALQRLAKNQRKKMRVIVKNKVVRFYKPQCTVSA